MQRNSSHLGLLAGTGAYLMWGMFPAFFGLLTFAGAGEILAQRIVWTAVVMVAVLLVLGRLGGLRGIPAKTWGYAAMATVAIATNWGVYLYGVTSGHVVECALGYFIGPLVSVLFGVALFRERLSRAQIGAVALATVAVVALTVDYGRPPIIALTLAVSFASYGLIKKLVPLDPLRSLTVESLIALPLALGYLVLLTASGHGAFQHPSVGHVLLLLACGPVTAVPLLLFGAAAQRIPLTTAGILQYVTPSLQMAWGVAVVHEAMPGTRWVGFALIWIALAIFTTDTVIRARTVSSPEVIEAEVAIRQ